MATEQSILEILLKAQNQADKVFDQARTGLDKTFASAKSAAAGWTDLMSAANAAGAVLSTGKQIIDEVIGSTVDYAEEVRSLSRLIGASAEESSKLIQAADDTKISYETLSAAMETAIRKGVEPSTAGMGRLADQYNAIQDPIARSKFLMDNFGRAGADLGPLMELGAQGMRELGEEAEKLGLVLSDADVKAARELEIQLDNLQDKIDAVKLKVGTETLPIINDFIGVMLESSDAVEEHGLAWTRYVPVLGTVVTAVSGIIALFTKEKEAIEGTTEAQNGLNEARSRGADALSKLQERAAANTANAYTTGSWNAGVGTPTYSGGYGSTPGRATGGQVWAGITRMVGEHGAEPFTPAQDGWVGAGAPAGGGGNLTVQVTIQSMFPPSDPRQLESVLRPAVESVARDLRRNGTI